MRIAIVTDAWRPQVNGVVTVLSDLIEGLAGEGHEVLLVEPSVFRCVPCPGWGEIGLAWRPRRGVAAALDGGAPDALHIATEGPLGVAARAWALGRRVPFTTAFHSRFPEFVAAATGIPPGFGYALLRRFHAPSCAVMVPSAGTLSMLASRGFANLRAWSHGIDLARFTPQGETRALHVRRPVFLFAGRVAPEKNLGAFLGLALPGTKVVAGAGPLLERLRALHPDVVFLGSQPRDALPALYRAADVFVHPSRTDTFGLVMLEALACGTPVAAFPVAGPQDVVGASDGGVLDPDLRAAALAALRIPRARARARALAFDCAEVRAQFVGWLAPIRAHAHDRTPPAAKRPGLTRA